MKAHRLHWSAALVAIAALSLLPASLSRAETAPSPVVQTTRTLDYTLQEWGLSGSYPITYTASQQGPTRIEVRDETGRVIIRLEREQIEAYRRFDKLMRAKLLARSPLGSARARSATRAGERLPTIQTPCVDDPFGPFVQPFQTIWKSQVTVNGAWR